MSQNELTAIIRELKEYQIMADEIAATIDDLKDKVKATMTAQGVDEMTVDIFKVKYIPVASVRLDSKALKSELPDIYNRFSKETTTRRFTVA